MVFQIMSKQMGKHKLPYLLTESNNPKSTNTKIPNIDLFCALVLKILLEHPGNMDFNYLYNFFQLVSV